jgi:bifunctional DNA-binding transcriptional regulator/antitoxin component of YhaV-PrlF toxin-antitoxin module
MQENQLHDNQSILHVIMDDKGGIIIPENIRFQLDLCDNEKLLLSVVDGAFIIKPLPYNE